MITLLSDPIFHVPIIGAILMCFTSALVGVICVLKKKSLLGEALSHATYPGIVISVVIAQGFFTLSEGMISIAILIGAFLFSIIGLLTIDYMEKKQGVDSDVALCFVLSTFLGAGILLASKIQITHALLYQQIQIFLYGQIATLLKIHLWIYGTLALLTCLVIYFLFRGIRISIFDKNYAKSIGIPSKWIDMACFMIIIWAIVIGIRSVGIIMMSGMLIIPATTARQWTSRLSTLFILSGIFGIISAFIGSLLSLQPLLMKSSGKALYMPTGPMIVLVASALCLLSLLLAPSRGLFFRKLRILRFNYKCLLENIVKRIWQLQTAGTVSLKEIKRCFSYFPFLFTISIYQLERKNWITKKDGYISLTPEGADRARYIVRLHRLWEAYLFSCLDMDIKKVHASAEEMEHILTQELEADLTDLLKNPKLDPHYQTIPERLGNV